MEKAETRAEGITSLFKTLSKPDAFRLFLHTSEGIKNSTYAIDELDLTPKRYYARLKELVDIGLVRKKKDGVYEHTALGGMFSDRFLPAMGKAVEAREELEFLVGLDGLDMENGVKKRILEALKIPIFEDSANMMIDDYESMVVNVIDLCDEAKESILMASNHLDVRVLDANFRSMNRGVKNSFILGREILSSKLQKLKMILSPKFTMAMINLASNPNDLNEMARVIDIPYSFCVVDGHINLIEISNVTNLGFIAAFYIKNRDLGEKLTNLFETLWKAGERHSLLKILNSFKE